MTDKLPSGGGAFIRRENGDLEPDAATRDPRPATVETPVKPARKAPVKDT